MAISVTHQFVSGIADSGDTSVVQPSDWNATHALAGLGTGVETALGVNVGSAGAVVTFNGAGGTPSSITLTNGTGLPVSTGISGLGTGVATALAVNVGSAGAPVVNGGALGTPSSGTLTNATGLPITAGTTGTLGPTRGGTGLATYTTGDLLYASAANTLSALAAGTDGYVLTMASGVPSWAAASGGGGSPGGSSGDLQYNSGGSFAGSILKQGTNLIEQYNGSNAQTSRIYNTYTDVSNYARGYAGFVSNIYTLGTEYAGSGSSNPVGIELRMAAPGYNGDSLFTLRMDYISGNYGLFKLESNAIVQLQGQAWQFAVGRQTNGGNVGSLGNDGIQWGAYVGADVYIDFRERVADSATAHLQIKGQAALASGAVTNLTGGNVSIIGGAGSSGSSGNAHGGNVYVRGGTGYGTGHKGYIIMDNLPTSASGLPTGALWNNGGVINIA